MIAVLAWIGLAGSLAALVALLDDIRRGDPGTLGYWTTTYSGWGR